MFDSWVGKIPWRRAWQSTPVVLLERFHGQGSLVGYSSWSRKELDMTEVTEQEKKIILLECKTDNHHVA